ncbi:17076_t:CDS:1, partial [Acaulospora morrowiae]
ANKDVDDSTNYCSICGTAFGTVAKSCLSIEVVPMIAGAAKALAEAAKTLVEHADKSGATISLSTTVVDTSASIGFTYTPKS